ncbi:MAG: site-specific integrase, partial [Clostridia bacterium]|nr:site-specific integrase [Clostridia bacterium]
DGKARLVFQEPKTEAGRRTIPLPEEVLKALRAHKARQAQERLAAGCGYRDHGLVFCTSVGTPVNPRNLVKSFHRLCKLAGIERANLHSLRHTFATRLLEANEHPKVVQELLGGSQIGVVLDLYSHVSMDLKRRAMERLDQELKRKALAQEGRERGSPCCRQIVVRTALCMRAQTRKPLQDLEPAEGLEPSTWRLQGTG